MITHCNSINGHGYVDLGLPSGLRWASCNIGALKPEEYGDYFAWGEINVKSTYNEDSSQTNNKDNEWLQENGYLNSEGNLTLQHDAARNKWGAPWRLPTQDEVKELVNNTTSEWTFLNGVYGRLLRSKTNSNILFLPTAGWIFDSSISNDGEYGSYWSSTPNEILPDRATSLDLGRKEFQLGQSYRDYGLTIRAVSDSD